jgi:hypothetical protein
MTRHENHKAGHGLRGGSGPALAAPGAPTRQQSARLRYGDRHALRSGPDAGGQLSAAEARTVPSGPRAAAIAGGSGRWSGRRASGAGAMIDTTAFRCLALVGPDPRSHRESLVR